MLQELTIRDFAIIEKMDLEFQSQMTVLTGETGAGKSIIIGSINLALGEKVSKEMLRDNEENAFVELIFDVESDAFAVIGLPASTIASIQTILMPHANTFFKPFFAFTL